jgi:hypothetical protein
MCAIFGLVAFVILIFMTIGYILGWDFVWNAIDTIKRLFGW